MRGGAAQCTHMTYFSSGRKRLELLREHLPTFIYVVQIHILDDAQEGTGDGLRTPRR
jgi:hypothetical protein